MWSRLLDIFDNPEACLIIALLLMIVLSQEEQREQIRKLTFHVNNTYDKIKG